MSLVIFAPNSDHCPQRTVHSFVNSNFKDYDLCRTDFIHSCLKIFYTNADTLLNKLNELRLITEASCHDVVITEVLPKNCRFCASKSVFIWIATSCLKILIFMTLPRHFDLCKILYFCHY